MTLKLCVDDNQDINTFSILAPGAHYSFSQLESGRFLGSTRAVLLDDIGITIRSNNMAYSMVGSAPKGLLLLANFESPSPTYYNGKEIIKSYYITSNQYDEHDNVIVPANSCFYAIAIHEDALVKHLGASAAAQFFQNYEALASFGVHQNTEQDLAAQLKSTMSHLISHGHEMNDTQKAELSGQVIKRCYQHLLKAEAIDYRSNSRSRLVSKAIDYIDTNTLSDINVKKIVNHCAVTPRNLQYAFSESLGITLQEFVLKQKLNAFRKQLIMIDEPKRGDLTRLANSLGIKNLSRYSIQYKAMFGETPRQTLNKEITLPHLKSVTMA